MFFQRIVQRLRQLYLQFTSWRSLSRRQTVVPVTLSQQIVTAALDASEEPDEATVTLAVPVVPPPIIVYPRRPGKWVTPKGPVIDPKPKPPPRPRAETAIKVPRPVQRITEDPEQLGQYYFRDVILDQLDLYWPYLRRMKRGDRDAYGLLRQVGIQLMPYSATSQYDRWREHDTPELSPWWHQHRPAFGAVAYGFDDVTTVSEKVLVTDFADPDQPRNNGGGLLESLDGRLANRPAVFCKSSVKYNPRQSEQPRSIWTPRFLYFHKHEKCPSDVERIEGGDTYTMTVYWDRCDKDVPKFWRSKRHGGTPQQYAVWVQHGGGEVRVLRAKINEKIQLKWAKGPHGASLKETINFTRMHWMVPDEFLRWTHRGREGNKIEPTDYLRRLFIEAATMYETSTLGSMVRIAITKGDLTATIGVDIKRMPYFFKDRDVIVDVNGRKKRIFHIVRPHVRKDGTAVQMHFRGLKEFDWAGYHVSITVPGRDHFLLPEFDIGMANYDKPGPLPAHLMKSDELGRKLRSYIKDGRGVPK